MFKIIRFTNYEKANEYRLKIIAENSYGVVLDIGASQNPNKFLSKNRYVKEIWSIDIKKPSRKLPKKYKKIIIFDLDNLDEKFPIKSKKFDTIIIGEVLEHLNNSFKILYEFKKLLKKGGSLIITTPTPKYYLEIINMILFSAPIGFPEHKNLFTRKQIFYMIKRLNLQIKKTVGHNFWILFLKIGFVQTKYKMPEIFTWQQIYIAKKR